MAGFLIHMLLGVVVGFVIGLAFLWLRGRRRGSASPEAADRRRWQQWEAHCAAHERATAGSTAITPPGPRAYTTADIDEDET